MKTVRYQNRYLVSRVDPAQEARRFVRYELTDRSPAIVVVLGEVLGYISCTLIENFQIRPLPVYFDSRLHDQRIENAPAGWHPGSEESIEDFLRRELKDSDLPLLAVIDWTPSTEAFAQTASEITEQVQTVYRALRANITTTAEYGSRWYRNSLVNSVLINKKIHVHLPAGPVFITASGPSLEQVLPILKKYRSRYILWALPSSLAALTEWEITPDLVILTDAGFYNRYHLGSTRGTGDRKEMPAAALAISASSVAFTSFSDTLVLEQGLGFDGRALHSAGMDGLRLPSHGTVAGTALHLAERLGAADVFYTGLDFKGEDLRSHVRPHSFDNLLMQSAERLNPLHHIYFFRSSGGDGHMQSLETYAAWFRRYCAALNKTAVRSNPAPAPRVYRIEPSSVSIPGIAELSREKAIEYLSSAGSPRFTIETLSLPPREKRARGLINLIEMYKETLNSAHWENALVQELLYYLNTIGLVDYLNSTGPPSGFVPEELIQPARKELSHIREIVEHHV
ncbi:MAG: DUF115 domain-containing protein [Spirochaetales bacterium]|nr:DUF115 domain-containing protein [Spirochaetales bacterium]MCF7938215.1 DUF115 domain-containing protein [Spirochaetales bacterium]